MEVHVVADTAGLPAVHRSVAAKPSLKLPARQQVDPQHLRVCAGRSAAPVASCECQTTEGTPPSPSLPHRAYLPLAPLAPALPCPPPSAPCPPSCLPQHRMCWLLTWSLGSLIWRHLTTISIASRHPNLCRPPAPPLDEAPSDSTQVSRPSRLLNTTLPTIWASSKAASPAARCWRLFCKKPWCRYWISRPRGSATAVSAATCQMMGVAGYQRTSFLGK